IAASGGSFAAFARVGETIAELDSWNVAIFSPPLVSNREVSVPGLRFRMIRFADGDPSWALEMSILIPGIIFCLLAGICILRYRAARRDQAEENSACPHERSRRP